MNPFKDSLIGRIRFLGLVLGFLMVLMLLLAYTATRFYAKREQVRDAIKLSELLFEHPEKVQEYLIENSLEALSEEAADKELVYADKLIVDPFIRAVARKAGMQFYVSDNHVLFSLTDEKTLYFRSQKNFLVWTVFSLILYGGLLFLIVYGIYYYIRNSLSPLVRLNQDIESFSKGKEVAVRYEKADDEIAKVSNAFYKAVEHNKKLKSQRDMFIRTIMHEIKTPLTKAKFITHFMQKEEEAKNKLNTLFDTMQVELDKLHDFESIQTEISKINMQEYSLNLLVEDVCDVLLLDEKHIEIDAVEVHKVFDYKLLMVVLKNLIDNAIKYSKDEKAIVAISSEYIEVKNRALNDKALDMARLYEPFEQEEESNSGMGLGLYLIREIVDKHHFRLEYTFADEMHGFKLLL